MAETAFQADAFQNDAFQVISVPAVLPDHQGGKGPKGPPHGAAVVVGPAHPRRITRIDIAAQREREAARLAELEAEEWLLILAIAEAA